MNSYDLNDLLDMNNMMTLDDLLVTMDSPDTTVYAAANDDYYDGAIAADDSNMVLN